MRYVKRAPRKKRVVHAKDVMPVDIGVISKEVEFVMEVEKLRQAELLKEIPF